MTKETTTVELNEKKQVKSYEQQSVGTLKTEDGRTLKTQLATYEGGRIRNYFLSRSSHSRL